MQLEPIRAVLTADSAQFVNGMNRAQGSLGNLTQTSANSHKAINVLKSGMVGLATQATGTAGPVGRLAQGLLMFGGGSGLVLGVAAGIGAIVLAYKALTTDAKEATKQQEDLIRALDGVGVHAQQTAARIKLSAARAALGPAMDVSQRGFFGRIAAIFETEGQQATREQNALRAESAALNELAQAAQKVAQWQKQVADDAEREAAARARTASLMRVVSDEGMLAAARLQGESLFQRDQAKMRQQLNPEIATQTGDFFRFHAKEIFLKPEVSESVHNFGVSLGRQFIMGMIEGIQSMQDLFKMVLMSVLDFGLGLVLNSIIPGGGSIIGTAVKDVGVQPKRSANMPQMQPVTSFFVARDPAFQQLLREGILVAGSQGFRG